MTNLLQQITALFLSILAFLSAWLCPHTPPPVTAPFDNRNAPLAERVGVTYWGSRYIPDYDAQQSGMRSAASALQALGTKVIKLSAGNLEKEYAFDNWDIPAIRELADVFAQAPFQEVFAADFTTYFIVAGEWNSVGWADGLDDAERILVSDEFYRAAKALFETYRGSGKTFILQNWEGDNTLAYSDGSQTAVQGITDYYNARQDGIRRAQTECGMENGVRVFGALEVNRILLYSEYPTLLEAVVPHTYADLYLYSAYEKKDPLAVGYFGEALTRKVIKTWVMAALDKLAEAAPDSEYFGANNIALSEFGYPETLGEKQVPFLDGDSWQRLITQATVEAGLDWGVQYMVYWELYCNEYMDGKIPQDWRSLTAADMNGFWLIRPDGSKTQSYDYFYELLHKE